MKNNQYNNSGLDKKTALRREALASLDVEPIVLETHAGEGLLFLQCYSAVRQGWAIDKENDLLELMTNQRPGWWCYQGESERLLEDAPRAFNANFIDIDAYGSPWPTMQALFNPHRFTHDRIDLVVHDGCLRAIAIGGNGHRNQRWRNGILAELADQYGDDLRGKYADVAMMGIVKLASACGFTIDKYKSFYSGKDSHNTHYWASLVKK